MADDYTSPETTPESGSGVYKEFGAQGLRQYHGFVFEEWLPQLIPTARATKVYREMRDNSSVIGAFLWAIEMLLRGVEWTVEPYDESPAAAKDAEFLESAMVDMSQSWEDMIAEILSMLVFGYSYHEIVYKKRGGDTNDPTTRSKYNDGLYGWRKIPIRAQETLFRWEFDDTGGLQGMWQRHPTKFTELFIPIESALLFRTTSHKGNPEGRSILRNAYRSWWFLKRLEEIEAIGVERDVAGIPTAGIPPELFNSNLPEHVSAYNMWKSLVTNLRNDEQAGILYPLSYDEHGNPRTKIELLSTAGQKQFNTDAIIARYRTDIALAALSDVILLGHEKVGTHALAVTKEDLFLRGLEAQLDMIAAVLNDHAVPRLFRLNGWPTDNLPTLEHGEIRSIGILDLTQAVLNLAQAGMPFFPDPGTEQHIRTLLDLPASDLADNIGVVTPSNAVAPGPNQPGAAGATATATSTTATPTGSEGGGGAGAAPAGKMPTAMADQVNTATTNRPARPGAPGA